MTSPRSEIWFRAWVLLAVVAASVTYAALNVDIAVIGDAIAVNAFLLPDAYVIGVACSVPLTPMLLGAWGPRRLLAVSLCGLLASSAAASLAHHGGALGSMLFLHGLFAAPVLPATQSLCATRFDDEVRRQRLGSFWMASTLLGTLAGYTAGGWVADHLGWRFALVLCWIPGLLALLFARWVDVRDTRSADGSPRSVDVVSAVLVGTVMLTMTAIVFVGSHTGWAASRGMRRMVAALALALVASLVRSRRSALPIIDLSVLADRRVVGALLCTFILNASSTGVFETEMLGQVLHMDPEWLSIRSSLGGVSMLAGVALADRLLRHLSISLAAGVSVLVLLVGKLGFLGYLPGVNFAAVLWPAGVSSVGYAMLSTVLAVTACQGGDSRRAAASATLYAVAVQLGTSMGLAALDATLQTRQDALLHMHGAVDQAKGQAYLQVFGVEAGMAALILPLALALLWTRPRPTPGGEVEHPT